MAVLERFSKCSSADFRDVARTLSGSRGEPDAGSPPRTLARWGAVARPTNVKSALGRLVWLLSMLLVTGGCRSGPEQWGPFRGQVVDAETGMPISGAHVMVTWIREPPSLHFSQRFYDAQETTTDTGGWFEIPRQTHFVTAFVNGPGFGFFAPGYLIQSEEVTPRSGRKYVDATVARMRPLKTREEQCKFEPFGVQPDAHESVPTFVKALREYQAALRCFA